MGPNIPSRLELPLLGSNQDSPDPESGVLPVTPRGTVPKDYTVGSSGRARANTTKCVGSWGSGVVGQHAHNATPAAREPVGPPHIPTSPLPRAARHARST